MDNKILTEETKETEKEAGKEVENGVSASDEAIKAVEAMKAGGRGCGLYRAGHGMEKDTEKSGRGDRERAWKSQCCCSRCHCKGKGKV